MNKVRLAAGLIVIATLVVLAENHFSKDGPLVAQYKLCLDVGAQDAQAQIACSDVLMEDWLPAGTRSIVLKYRAYTYRKQRNYEQALSDLDEAAALSPDDANVYEMRAGIYLWLEDLDRAERDYQRAVAVDPANVRFIRWWIKRMSQLGHPQYALAACEHLALAVPETNSGASCKVKPLLRLEQTEEAIQVLKRLVETGSNKEKAGAYFFLGRVYLHLDYGKEETLAAFEMWRNMEMEDSKSLPDLFLAATYLKFGDQEEGEKLIDDVARHMMQDMLDHPVGPWKTVKMMLVRGVFRDALPHHFRGLAYSMIREYNLARHEFDMYLKLGGPNARSLLINVMLQNHLVPGEAAARSDQRVFQRGLERYMTDAGRKYSLDALLD